MKKYLDLIRLREWWHFILMIVFSGAYISGNMNVYGLIWIFIVSFLIHSYIFSINDVFDAEFDRMKPNNKNIISKGIITKRRAAAISLIFLLAGFIVTYIFLPKILILYLTGAVLTMSYSSPPLRLKERFPFDSIAHGLGPMICFVAAYILFTDPDIKLIFASAIIFLLYIGSEIVQEIRDFKVDSKSGFNTTVIVLGIPKSILFVKAIILTVAIASILMAVYFFPIYYIIIVLSMIPSTPIFMRKYKKGEEFVKDCFKAANRFSLIFIASLIIVVFMLFLK